MSVTRSSDMSLQVVWRVRPSSRRTVRVEQSELVVTLLFLAWHVRMESRSDLSSLSNVKTFSTLNSDR